MTLRRIPPLKRKRTHEIAPDSLAAALRWDKIAAESLGDNDIPLAPGIDKIRKSLDEVWANDSAYQEELEERVEAGASF